VRRKNKNLIRDLIRFLLEFF